MLYMLINLNICLGTSVRGALLYMVDIIVTFMFATWLAVKRELRKRYYYLLQIHSLAVFIVNVNSVHYNISPG